MGAKGKILVLVIVAVIALVGLPTSLEYFDLGPDMSVLPPPGRVEALADGRRVHYRTEGNGDPVILIHGLPGLAADWRELVEPLVERGKQVIAYDRVGYGYSTGGSPDDPDDFTFASNARDLKGLLDALELERVDLVGWSYGGGVAQAFAVANPERVSKLVLIASVGPDTPVREDDPLGIAATLVKSRTGQSVVEWIARVPPLAWWLVKPGVIAAFSREDAIPPGWDDYVVAMMARPGAVAAYSAEAARHDFAALRPEAIPAPALVIQGNDDQLIPFSVAENLVAKLPNAKLVPIFEGSHMLPVTHARSLGETVGRFLGP